MKKMRDNSNCFVDKSMSMFDLKEIFFVDVFGKKKWII